ncbi:DUF2975 domain-containing protein [uncultured Erythrobacter sp.]|uniref:DUF2975 domain-containing protein n=1 Tax=uncultured Erythrobacter sp. TaxID=263913 RepID=UPI00265B1604|nr:DUF2975 domain-containing protein [uncultured Erythrobacter sp.]
MKSPHNDLLLLAGKTLTLLIQGVMGLAALVIGFVVIAITVFRDSINQEIRSEFGAQTAALPAGSVLWLLLVVLAMVALIFLFFGKLRGIIDTVAEGDPFVPENADRLNAMAWLQIGIYILGLVAAAAGMMVVDWAGQFADVEIDGSLDLDLPNVLMVLVLFILARVFRQGAAMRDDLEGTV